MATDKRTSEQGSVFDAAIIREFLLAALSHDAVIDKVDDLLFEHAIYSRFHPSVITENLRPLIAEVLDTATQEDWQYVADKLIRDARETLTDELSSEPSCRTARQEPDPGELREELGNLYTQDLLSPSKARRAWKIIRQISRLVGISGDEVQANARTDAEAIQAANDYDAVRADRSSAQTPTGSNEPVIDTGNYQMLRQLCDEGGAVYIQDTNGKEIQGWVTGVAAHEVSVEEVRTRKTIYICLADIQDMQEIEALFVRPLSGHEVSVLIEKSVENRWSTRKRAAIILASNFGNTVAQIAAKEEADARYVRRVITDFNEHGLKSLERG